MTYRIVWLLDDGRKKYLKEKKKPKNCTTLEVQIWHDTVKRNGDVGFSKDLSYFSPSAKTLERMGMDNVVKSSQFITEPSNTPLTAGVLI